MKVLVTGGAGYIGSHTILELIDLGFKEIVSVDNYLNSDESTYKRIEQISGIKITHFQIDLSDSASCAAFFNKHQFDGIIHFAALKSVPESVEKPNLYYQNNLNALLNLLKVVEAKPSTKLIYSSSCSVYGNPEKLPVTEETPYGKIESPYANTKKIGEEILLDFCHANPACKVISLRYFNPAGAHPSGIIGETKTKRPNNLVPIIAQQAIGMRESFTVFGSDYDTLDGSCIRDYVHVSDIANAHVLALNYLGKMDKNYDVLNLGSGKGSTTLEVVHAFEKVNKQKLNYSIGPRRAGDVSAIYADNKKAREKLNWEPQYQLEDIVASAWKWQQNADQ
ncbi:MAG: UDP-glucose 4-epimerase GalE [Vicingaceae bacterium]